VKDTRPITIPSDQHIRLLIQAGAFRGFVQSQEGRDHVVRVIPRKGRQTTIRREGNRTVTAERETLQLEIIILKADGTIETLR